MNRVRGRSLSVVLFLLGTQVHAGEKQVARVAVRIYNYAGLDTEVLGGAEAEAGRIFRQAGVEVLWIGLDQSRGADKIPVGSPDETVFNLKLLSESMAARVPRPAYKFGFALHLDTFVFVHRVKQLTRDTGLPLPLVLGHIMAHELGHLMLGESSHSLAGLMSKTLRQSELRLAAQGGLLFSTKEARRMRSRLEIGRSSGRNFRVTVRPNPVSSAL